MKKYLLPENGQFYKANLHCHTNVSDGRLSPAEMKEEYKKRGYSVIAYTDHNVLVPHPELTDEEFVALHGVEYDLTEEAKNGEGFHQLKTCHICLVGTDPDYTVQPCFRDSWLYQHLPDKSVVQRDESIPPYEFQYNADYINDMIKTSREKGYFVTYNHPAWSQEGYEIYSKYEGMNAMEICNYGCMTEGYHDYNPHVYDELLRQGKKLYCIATDDNHNGHPMDSPYCDSFGGFTMIKADKLEYRTITDALLKGNFYASQGPEIHSLYVEDNKLHIKSSDAARIVFTTGLRRSFCAYPLEGDTINEAEFELRPDDIYVRVTVFDKSGKPADTNAYFMEDIL